jgi:KUP system potassium uptake protein
MSARPVRRRAVLRRRRHHAGHLGALGGRGAGRSHAGFKPFVMPLALGILVVLFVIQRHGTASVGKLFGPGDDASGSPRWRARLVARRSLASGRPARAQSGLGAVVPRRHPGSAFFSLGAVVLVRSPAARRSTPTWGTSAGADQVGLVRHGAAALLINYFGQGALLLDRPGDHRESRSTCWRPAGRSPAGRLATAATVIASQAVISGAFSITSRPCSSGICRAFEVRHTSESEMGQIYLPASTGCCCCGDRVGLGFRLVEQHRRGLRHRRHRHHVDHQPAGLRRRACAVEVELAALLLRRPSCSSSSTFAFFSANSTKILDGGWFPLAFGLLGVYAAGDLASSVANCSRKAAAGLGTA